MLVNSGLMTLTVGMGAATFGLTFLITEITGYTNVTKTAIQKTKDWFNAIRENRKIFKQMGSEEITKRMSEPGTIWDWGVGLKDPDKAVQKTDTESPEEKSIQKTKKNIEELKKALSTLGTASSDAINDSLAQKTQKASNAFENLAREAKNTSKSIEQAWLEMTGSQRDILESWHKDQLDELEKSKDANQNYQRDKIRLEETYQEKLRQLLNTEAKERQSMIKEITDSYRGMYDTLNEMGLKGSDKDIFNLEKAAADDVQAASDYFAKLTADYTAATAEQKKNILDGIKEAGFEYKLTVSDMLDFSVEQEAYAIKRKEQLQKDYTAYLRQCGDIRANVEESYNQLSLSRLKAVLTEENALRLNQMESQKAIMDTYQEAFLASVKTIADLAAGMYKGIFTGVQTSISDLITGISSLGEALQAFGETLLRVIGDWVAQKIAGALMVSLFEQNWLETLFGQEVAKEEAIAGIKSASVAAETSEKIAAITAMTTAEETAISAKAAAESAAIGSVAAAQTAAQASLLATGLASLEAFSIASIAQGAAIAAAWAAAAANVSLASFGSNSAPAMAGISAIHALTTALSMPKLAEGGLTTGPTIAMIGEGRYKEAVLPLSDKTFDRLADGINKASGQRGNTEINVYGDINSASDEDRIFSELFKNTKFALMGA